jgi:heptosyltransferase-3
MDAVVRLSDMIASQHELIPVWTSSPDPTECAGLHKYSAKCTIKPKVIPGDFSLNQMACLMEGAALYIGLDTAVTHIAASTGVPLVALYGPTETHRWFPWNNSGTLDQLQKCPRGRHRNGNTILIQNECRHPHCIRPECTNRCMQRISVEDVFTAAETLLLENRANRHTTNRETGA